MGEKEPARGAGMIEWSHASHGGCSSVGSSARLWFWMSWVQIPPAAPDKSRTHKSANAAEPHPDPRHAECESARQQNHDDYIPPRPAAPQERKVQAVQSVIHPAVESHRAVESRDH